MKFPSLFVCSLWLAGCSNSSLGAHSKLPEAITWSANCPAAKPQPCPLRAELGEESAPTWDPLLRASDYGEGARFVAMGGDVVLLERRDGEQEVLRAKPFWQELLPRQRWQMPAGPLRAIDVTDFTHEEDVVYVLACTERDVCELLIGRAEGGVLMSMAHGVLPKGARPTQLLAVDGMESAGVCVLSDGVVCRVAERWLQLMPSGGARRFVAGAVGAEVHVVDDQGQIWRGDWNDGSENAQASAAWLNPTGIFIEGAVTSMTGYFGAPDAATAIVAGGRLMRFFEEPERLEVCPQRDLYGVSPYSAPSARLEVWTQIGALSALAHGSPRAESCMAPGVVSGTPLEVGAARCHQSLNRRLLTDQMLYGGQDGCDIICAGF